jgi:hypothetical protein
MLAPDPATQLNALMVALHIVRDAVLPRRDRRGGCNTSSSDVDTHRMSYAIQPNGVFTVA